MLRFFAVSEIPSCNVV